MPAEAARAPEAIRDAIRDAIRVDIEVRTGSFRLAAAFASSAPWTVLFGPSGSGKSTLLRTIAGFLRPERGSISILGRTVVDRTRSLHLPAHCRPVRWAGQRTTLFRTMTVEQNLAFAVRQPSRRGESVARALATFGLDRLARSYPAALSGGQQQQVAVARAAIDAADSLLVLDEPFAGLDEAIRAHLIDSLRAWRGVAPVLSVTHDVGEAFLLEAEIVRLQEGRIVAQGSAAEVLAGERERLRAVLG